MPISSRRRWAQAIVALALWPALGWLSLSAVRTWRASADADQAQALASASTAQALGFVEAGLRWRSDDADLWRQRADLASFAAPLAARSFARRAVRLNPRDWRAWQTLGLLDYRLGDLPASRRDLAQAVRYDHGFASHFAVGNLALAQGNQAEFLKEMTAALAIAPLDRVNFAVRQVLSHATLAPSELAAVLPSGRADVVAQGIELYLQAGKLAAAAGTWKRLSCRAYQVADCRRAALALANGLIATAFAAAPASASSQSRETALADSGFQSSAELIATATEVWNQAAAHRILAEAPVVVGAAADGRFQHAWVGPAFSWQSTPVLPLQILAGGSPRGNAARIPFNGYQPDDAGYLYEYVPVEPDTTYSISFLSRRQREGAESGVTLGVLVGPGRELASIPARLDQTWAMNSKTFTVPAGIHLLELAFTYSRPQGQVRLHDPILIADVAMRKLSR